jgi:spore maturation protein CgeB
MNDAALRQALVSQGWQTIQDRHSCAHRARELLDIVDTLRDASTRDAA